MILRRVRTHYVIWGDGYTPFGPKPPAQLGYYARLFWDRVGLGEAERAIVAYEDGKLLGFFRYNLDVPRTGPHAGERQLHAAGTWVEPCARRRGLAARMWQKALRAERPAEVTVVTASPSGEALVRALKTNTPGLRWYDYG